jgi:hypothetical protein
LVDPEQTTKHEENVKHKDISTKYRQGSLQFLGEGEKKMPFASVNVTSLLEYIYPEMSLVKWDSKLETHMRQLHTLGSLFEKGGCFKKCVVWRDSPCFRTKNKVDIAKLRIGEQVFLKLKAILARNPGLN